MAKKIVKSLGPPQDGEHVRVFNRSIENSGLYETSPESNYRSTTFELEILDDATLCFPGQARRAIQNRMGRGETFETGRPL